MKWDYRFSMKVDFDCPDKDLEFIRQLGVELVYTWLPAENHTMAELTAFQERLQNFGLTLHNVLSGRVAKNAAIHLNLPGRDGAISDFMDFLRMLQNAGIKNTTFTWEPDHVWSSGRDGVTRFSKTRYVSSDDLRARPLNHGREYSREELWENFEYLMKKIIPVAEETGVRLALHPNDPPVEFPIAGVPTLIRSYEDYKRAFKIADSKMLGMEFCCGCWLEGGESFGNILENLAEFVDDNRVIVVHFRNISSPLPDFSETYLDNGFFDMRKPMDVLRKHGYSGTITLDHTPEMVDGPEKFAPRAYAIGYMRALAEREF